MPRKFTDDEIITAGDRAVAEAGGDIRRVTPGALRRLLGGGEPNANHARMLALLGPATAPIDAPAAASAETAAVAAELAGEISTLVAERAAAAMAAREAEITMSAERRVALATREAEQAQEALAATRAAHDADVATLESERDAAREAAEGLRRALDAARGQIEGLTAALTALGAKAPRKPRRPKVDAGVPPPAEEIAAAA